MNEYKNYLKNYDKVSVDLKYVANSIIRLKILSALFEKPQNVRELASVTKINYSSIANTVHGLELKDFVYRESNMYHLSNSLKIHMKNVLEFKEVSNLLNRFFDIVDGHMVDMIPHQSVGELYLLAKANLLESEGVDVYKINDFIENSLSCADRVQCIMPVYHINFNKKLNLLVTRNKFVEVFVSEEVFPIYEKKSQVKYLSSFRGKNNFLLIVTDEMMILGFFKDDGSFDQNRLVTSRNDDAIGWAINLFKNFKKKNK